MTNSKTVDINNKKVSSDTHTHTADTSFEQRYFREENGACHTYSAVVPGLTFNPRDSHHPHPRDAEGKDGERRIGNVIGTARATFGARW